MSNAQAIQEAIERESSFPISDRAAEIEASLLREDTNESDDDFAQKYFASQGGLGSSPPPDLHTRFALGVLGNTFEEQVATFRLIHPDGQLQRVPTTGMYVFRETSEQPFRRLDPTFWKGLSGTDIGKEIMGDVLDMGDDAFEILGEAAFLSIFKRPGFNKVITTRLGRLGFGAAFGTSVQEATQLVAGTQRQPFASFAALAALEGSASIVGGTLGIGASKAIEAVRGSRGIANITERGRKALVAGRRLGTLPPIPAQVADLPILQFLAKQSAVHVGRLQQYIRKQREQIQQRLKSIVDPIARRRFRARTEQALDQAETDIVEAVRKNLQIGTKPKDARQTFRALTQLFEGWWDTSRRDVDTLFDVARQIEEPTFNASPILRAAIEVEASAIGRSAPKQKPTGLLGAAGEPLTREVKGDIVRRQISPELQGIINRIKGLDPAVAPVTDPATGITTSAVDQLRNIRSDLADLTIPGAKGARLPEAQATKLRRSIDEVLEDPTNTNPQFLAAWKAANKRAARRFNIREQAAVMELAAKKIPPEEFVQSLVKPGSSEKLIQLRKVLGPKGFDRIRDFAKAEIIKDPATFAAKLKALDPTTKRILFPGTNRKVLFDAAGKLEALGKTNLRSMLAKQSSVESFIDEVVGQNNTAAIAALNDLVTRVGGRGSALGKSTRAAVLDSIFRKVQAEDRIGPKVDPARLKSIMDDFRKKGLTKFLEIADVRKLLALRDLTQVADISIDAGTALIGAQTAATGARGVTDAAARTRFIATMLRMVGVGRMMTTDRGQRILTGKGQKVIVNTELFQMIGGFAGTLLSDFDVEGGKKQENEFARFELLKDRAGSAP